MSKSLIIAEKPSVANDLARALGGFKKVEDHFENENYIISSAVGHLVELCLPSELDVKRGKWSFANLPIIPDEFELKPIEKSKPRFNQLKRLIQRKDVADLINACDAGREGELIFRYLVKLTGSKKPIRRLWLQSMTTDSIRSAFGQLRTNEEMIPLAKAAVCRSESDWLVGINGTRAMTAFNNKAGGFQLTPVGRVQTPTLAILTEREEKIRAFKSRPFFEVFGDFGVKAGEYRGRWFREDFAKDGDEDARAERIWESETAEDIKARCLGKTGIATEERKPTSQAPPLLYDLTSLQRDANGRGFSAKRTLQIAQQLYEKFKLITYPRTDSRYLPEDYIATVKGTLGKIKDPALAVHARKAVQMVKPSKRIFNNAKISDHFAIVPSGEVPHGLDEVQQKIYDMIVRRFIAVFFPAALFEVTTRITRVEKDAFRTDGKVITDPGWLAVYGREAALADDESGASLVPIADHEPAKVINVEVKQNETKPPARFNEATLLSAMEGAGKLVDDEELREAMSANGLGTPATRAAIIEGLIYQEYVRRQGRELIATAKGLALITLLRGIGVSALCSPEMTGEWEHKLKRIQEGEMKRKEFMAQIKDFTREIVEKAKNFEGDSVSGNFAPLNVKCPKCGKGPFDEDYRTFKCASCGLIVWKTMAGRLFEAGEVETLLTEGKVGPLEGFRSKMGRPFTATVKLGEEFKPQFEFENNDAAGAVTIDPARHEALGVCPVCQKGQVYALDNSYACENAVSAEKTCTFRVGKVILQREIPKEQIQKLIATGKTDLLPKFISKKGRPFSAHLKLEKDRVGFEFAEKAPRRKKLRREKQPWRKLDLRDNLRLLKTRPGFLCKKFGVESIDATTYGVLLTPPTLCVVPSAAFVTTKSSTPASLVIVPASAAAAFVYSARNRFTTYEQIERSDLRVIKRDRTHEPFDRRKLVNSLAKACEKRSISLVTLETAVDEIVHELETSGREVPSATIGTKVLEKLRVIDEVAYLRYASVHRRFEEVDQFVDAIQALGRRIKPNALQPELFEPEMAQGGSHPAAAGAPDTETKVETHGRV